MSNPVGRHLAKIPARNFNRESPPGIAVLRNSYRGIPHVPLRLQRGGPHTAHHHPDTPVRRTIMWTNRGANCRHQGTKEQTSPGTDWLHPRRQWGENATSPFQALSCLLHCRQKQISIIIRGKNSNAAVAQEKHMFLTRAPEQAS
jgi:hypothetical protein